MFISRTNYCLVLLVTTVLLTGCATTPKYLDSQDQDSDQGFTRTVELSTSYEQTLINFKQQENTLLVNSSANMQRQSASAEESNLFLESFVRGDILNISVDGLEQFDGLYQITQQGTLELPYTNAIQVEGLTRAALTQKLKTELIELNWFYQDYINLDVSIVRLAPVNVSVTGAVFNPGVVSINDQPALKSIDPIQQRSGAFATQRNLVAAIQAAGGIRPDADLKNVYIKRGPLIYRVALENILSGNGFVNTPYLVHGDEILVVSTDSENSDLVRPSQITPPGMRVLMSNLTAPALTNAQSAIGADATRLPYGASLLDSAISANCIGGTHSANASRSVVLITRNHGSKMQLVVKRTINELLANSSSEKINPFLMPNDGVACYDSRFTNFRDVARGIGELVGPFILGGLL